ncbi:HEAT repeat domain-containing protein [Cocleimonas sp. KMM 6892]|uniref:HEAT repeat domain-containing protein n=1 Tax=unclassified Cocleimonas TaxID=2639732 RepID=UPI002DB9C97F|nr:MULTISPECIES: HEAT repeat domain-containing protein [unclassified Cocleimonas]MEB8433250.1 HEAT repeat domain-containing protein [Cocleimonas sp. KMM 6892]MEC4715769.1 HEAT repeat domain-containing protein [Cocleimonas sp. KMM 6895]MEC4745230.1 HEAT repeat domain-containing protein [Cocleimonas sp. KMM 6896]
MTYKLLKMGLLKVTLFILLANTAVAENIITLDQTDPDALLEAIYNLSSEFEEKDDYLITDEVISRLAELLSHENEDVNFAAAGIFDTLSKRGDIFDESFVDNLVSKLSSQPSTQPTTQQTGNINLVSTIGLLGGPKYIPELVTLLDKSPAEFQRSIIKTLGEIQHEDALPAVIAALKNKDEDVRLAAIKAIGKIHHKDGVMPLIGALTDSSDYVKSDAAQLLGKFKDSRAVLPLIEYLKKHADQYAINSLGKIDDKRIAPFLVEGLNKNVFYDDAAVKAIQLLRKLEGEKEAFDGLLQIVKNEDQDNLARMTAFTSLGNTKNHRATNDVLSILQNEKESPLIHRYAAKCLGLLGDKKAVSVLNDIVFTSEKPKVSFLDKILRFGNSDAADLMETINQDRNASLKTEAVIALGKLDAIESVDQLLTILEQNKNKELTIGILEVLGSTESLKSPKTTETLIRYLSAEDKYIRIKAARSLQQYNDKQAIPALTKALKTDKEKDVRRDAIKALIHLNGEDLVGTLIPALNDKSEYVRLQAIQAIGKSQSPEVLPALLQALNDSSRSIRSNSREFLVERADATLIKQYIQTLQNEQEKPEYRTEFVEILSHINQPEVVNALFTTLNSEHKSIRLNTIYALGALKVEASVDKLINIMSDENQKPMHTIAFEALTHIGKPIAIPELIKAIHKTKSPWDQSRQVKALCQIKEDPRVAETLKQLSFTAGRAYTRKQARCISNKTL